jgi:hypothetical protein
MARKSSAAAKEVEAIDWSDLEAKPKVKETKRGVPGMAEMIKAFCAQCMGDYLDGRDDCGNPKCPLYRSMPYGKLEPDYEWRTTGGHRNENRRILKFQIIKEGVAAKVAKKKKKKKKKAATKKKKVAKKRKK